MQIKFSFDRETLQKILKSFWISLVPSVIVFTIGFIANLPISNVVLSTFVAWVAPVLIYAVGKVKEGTLTWAKFGWSVFLSTATAGVVVLYSTDWCQIGQVCTVITSLITLFFPVAFNALKEWIRGTTGYSDSDSSSAQ